MKRSTFGKSRVGMASGVLSHLATDPASGQAVVAEPQKLHGATSDADPQADPKPAEPPVAAVADEGAVLLETTITQLLQQIGEGFEADDDSNFEKLTIARKYGALLWDLKHFAPHGSFKQMLKDRFPKVNYSKCNRWMYIAKHEAEVAAAIEKYPEVAWGPKKMIDYLKGDWIPEEEADGEEDDCFGNVREEHVEQEPLLPNPEENVGDVPEPDATSPYAVGALNPELAAAVEEHQQESEDEESGTTAGPVTQAVRTQPHAGRNGFGVVRPAVNRTEFEVEVRLSFRLSVPAEVTAEVVTEAIQLGEHWTVGIETPFEYDLSEKMVVVGHVLPWHGPAPAGA